MTRFDSFAPRWSVRSLLVALLGACSPAVQTGAAVPIPPAPNAATGSSQAERIAALHASPIDLMPTGLTTHGATTLGNSVYILGGYSGSPHNYNQRDQSRDFMRFDLGSRTWTQLSSLGPLQSAVLVNDGRYVYRVGGMRALNQPGEPEDMHSQPDVERFDPSAGTWQPLAKLPAPRSSHQAVLLGTRLYVMGGWALAGGSFDSTWQDTLVSCDLAAPECVWQSEPLPFSVRAMGAAVHAGKIYVLGGLTPEGSSDDVHVYDPSTRTWSLGAALPKGNLTICAAELGGELFANGGDGTVYRLAPDASAWSPAAKLLFPRMFHQLVATPEGLLALGGVPAKARGARVRHVERVSPQLPPASVVWNLRAESAAKNRQGSFLLAQQLYVFGGNNSLEQHDFEPHNFVDTAHRLDLGSLEWKPVEAFPRARQSMQTLVAGTDEKPLGFVMGGFGWNSERLSSQSEVLRFDFEAGKWSSAPIALPEARSQFGLVEWDNAAWIFGGLNFDKSRKDDEFQHPMSIVRFDPGHPEAGFSPAGAELRQMRRAFAGALLGERYYLTGGLRDNFESVTECEVVDLKSKTSQAMTCPSQHRLGGQLVPLGDALYLVGGSAQNAGGQREPTGRIEKYDPGSDRWTTLSETLPLDTPKQLVAFPFEDRLLLYSANRPTQTVQIALIDPQALASGRTGVVTLTVPSSGGASGPATPAPP